MSPPYYFLPLLLLFFQCRHDSPGVIERRPIANQNERSPASLAHFEAAEQQVALGHYMIAAKHLNKGIITFRVETGKMSGRDAIRANQAIDGLIRLRKVLRHDQAVSPEALHQAIHFAMQSEPLRISPIPKPAPEIVVPVSGN